MLIFRSGYSLLPSYLLSGRIPYLYGCRHSQCFNSETLNSKNYSLTVVYDTATFVPVVCPASLGCSQLHTSEILMNCLKSLCKCMCAVP